MLKILIADDELIFRRLARAALESGGPARGHRRRARGRRRRYITKPYNPAELRARVQVGVRMLDLRTALAGRVIALEAALSQVDHLQGLLPMCAWCKKIRDEKNYWQQVEQYIAGHTKAQFTHSICPECRDTIGGPKIETMRGTPLA